MTSRTVITGLNRSGNSERLFLICSLRDPCRLIGWLTALWSERLIPDPYGGDVAVIAQDAQGTRTQQKVLTAGGRQPDPPRHQHAQYVSMPEQSDVAVDRARSDYHSVHARTHLIRRLAAWAAIPKNQPVRRGFVD